MSYLETVCRTFSTIYALKHVAQRLSPEYLLV
jgi:hypothetical protein